MASRTALDIEPQSQRVYNYIKSLFVYTNEICILILNDKTASSYSWSSKTNNLVFLIIPNTYPLMIKKTYLIPMGKIVGQ